VRRAVVKFGRHLGLTFQQMQAVRYPAHDPAPQLGLIDGLFVRRKIILLDVPYREAHYRVPCHSCATDTGFREGHSGPR
jgi:hypothetical protein